VDGKPVDVSTLLHQAADDVRPFVQIRHQTLDVDVAAGVGSAHLDAPKMRDGINHLLLNAIKFTPDGGRITLSGRRTNGTIEIRTADNGVGMDAETLQQLFRPFFTSFDVSHHSSGQYEFCRRGLGLGLSVVKAFVDLHGGNIRAESETGKGTTIIVTLPDAPPASKQPTTTAEPVAAT
jgi:signal transduction histidine kinase